MYQKSPHPPRAKHPKSFPVEIAQMKKFHTRAPKNIGEALDPIGIFFYYYINNQFRIIKYIFNFMGFWGFGEIGRAHV